MNKLYVFDLIYLIQYLCSIINTNSCRRKSAKSIAHRMRSSQSNNEYEYDSELQEQAQLSKLQNLSNYLKQIGLHISVTLKQPQLRDYLKNAVENFDKSIEQYNSQYFETRINNLIYFKIQMLALSTQESVIVQEVYNRDRNGEVYGPYFARMVFLRQEVEDQVPKFGTKKGQVRRLSQQNYYRMHVQLWKKTENGADTNCVLTCFERGCMNDIFDTLSDKGYIGHVQGSAVYIKTKKPALKSVARNVDNSLTQILRVIIQKFLKGMSNTLINCQVCSYCKRHMAFEQRLRTMMPPTMTLWICKDKPKQQALKQNREDAYVRKFHQGCALKYMRAPPVPAQFKPHDRGNTRTNP